MNCIHRLHMRQGAIALLCCLLIWPSVSSARDPADPGKGFDYVFYGFSPPNPSPVAEGSSRNRAMLLLDIDEAGSPRPYPAGPKFKLLVESPVGSGELEVLTSSPVWHRLIGKQDDHPARFIFSYFGAADNDGGALIIRSDAALEANGQHYLRDVIDVAHKRKRTRYRVNCETFDCDVPFAPYNDD